MTHPLRWAAAALLAATVVGAIGPACPSRDLEVDVSQDGAGTIFVACEAFRDACNKESGGCLRNAFLCDPGHCKLRDACGPDPPPTNWEPDLQMAAQMLLLTADPLTIQDSGSCQPLNLHACLTPGDLTCPIFSTDINTCVTDAIRTAVQASLDGDLTFGGFHDPSSTLLVLALYQVPNGKPSCSASVASDTCTAGNLVATAGFAPPIGGAVYDISCASCFAGERTSIGHDTGPCPVTKLECFTERIAGVLPPSP